MMITIIIMMATALLAITIRAMELYLDICKRMLQQRVLQQQSAARTLKQQTRGLLKR